MYLYGALEAAPIESNDGRPVWGVGRSRRATTVEFGEGTLGALLALLWSARACTINIVVVLIIARVARAGGGIIQSPIDQTSIEGQPVRARRCGGLVAVRSAEPMIVIGSI